MLPTYANLENDSVSEEEAEASRFIMKTLGVLLIIALIAGGLTGEFGIAIWCAFMAWIPAGIVAGGIKDEMVVKRQDTES